MNSLMAIEPLLEVDSVHHQQSEHATVLTKIYEPDTNIVIWQHALSPALKAEFGRYLETAKELELALQIATSNITCEVSEPLKRLNFSDAMVAHIIEIVDMFSCLFELRVVGFRLKMLKTAMCPKFHVDKVPVRLVTTLVGAGSEWLRNQHVSRDGNKLTVASEADAIQLACGDVALLKGERWEGNEGRGLVHRSPAVVIGEKRLLLTLDFIA
ncbi:DUF1826 domain-containing protein [Pseudoalteromonas piscicida]|uniref:DUF1826 domain-containing protein n=1 Tax=Pseudoalteromonas piscicida TaxID=43662 RepID=A0AAQ2EXS3_PSEO7|nr:MULTISPECIES: DUF1826 domain-containing protein [Pseudoalteromonas]KJY92459.1 hypothetical protein TW75_01835 [Pseudoalteromonas piscicida]TMN38241.1 DUF1826 domain-containing protein [Pseudoalteromonas piscicida]TMN39488.1 DUF1826 domain-containing protein [Pseudoalteromonas piscicida]TMN50261.1 DUF1826 domain-containing protein [Pseudoalteromonas piscicida]TMN52479.1 DUF1826 domain-containing protein [Pseudoalteromonas piscicida]